MSGFSSSIQNNKFESLDPQESVKDKDLTAPPASPTKGDRYIVASPATGAWLGKEKSIAEYTGLAWKFTTPNQGFSCVVEDEDITYVYNSLGAWVTLPSVVAGSLTTDDISEGSTNLYFSGKTTDDLTEGSTNKYDTGVPPATTDDLTEGSTNLYFSGKTTDDLTEGSTNKYDTGVPPATTDDLTEGSTNLYFSGKTTDDLTEGSTNLYFSGKTTDDLTEGSTNLYFSGKTTDDLTEGSTNLYANFIDDTLEPNGFLDKTATLSWSDSSPDRTFSITGNHEIYCEGKKYSKTDDSIQISTDVGLHFIYYDSSGTLTESTTFPGFSTCLIATVYWNGTAGLIGEERHGIIMDANTHKYLHETVGARFESGFAGSFADATFSIDSGIYHDEDIEHDLSTGPFTTCRVFYKDGSANWTWTSLQTQYYLEDGSSDIRYNNGNALASAGANQYVAYWFFVTNEPGAPIVALMGQRVDGTLTDARANNTYASLSFGTLPFKEMKLLYRVILRNDATPYEEAQDYRSVSNLPAGTYVATDHGTLTGLLDDDHTQYALVDPGLCEGRLTLTTGTPVTTADVTAAGTLYFTPYNGNGLALYTGTTWKRHSFTELSLGLTLTDAKNYDVFVYDNSGTLTLELSSAWTNDTTRADALALQDGVYVKSGATTRRWLGTIRASGTNTTEDSLVKRFVWNAYNQVERRFYKAASNSHTYNTATRRQWDNDTANQIAFVWGLANSLVFLEGTFNYSNSSGPAVARPSISLDNATSISGTPVYLDCQVAGIGVQSYSTYLSAPAIGYHFLAATEYADTTATTTFVYLTLQGNIKG